MRSVPALVASLLPVAPAPAPAAPPVTRIGDTEPDPAARARSPAPPAAHASPSAPRPDRRPARRRPRRSRIPVDGVLSILYQRRSTGTAPSAIRVLDLRLG
ncbi:hypothetical protein [Catenuloplanes atrovinosus]|uniref:Uncharacterized protein n=1 Tax=Catenuloplanes atrovinosus TaxID=137266 RepID=A0AAE3YLJ0_9ACTN|nr:hypothetical protein [Catenuloplanes atrovinosus]MDR7274443.1 hypothetical protein [Catenuloplanes atrovinosus]